MRYWDGSQWTTAAHGSAAAPAGSPSVQMDKPVLDPRTKRGGKHVFPRRTPMDRLDRTVRHCPECQRQTTQDRFKVIADSWAGFGLPLLRKRTAGKTGKRTHWSVCTECGCAMPEDAGAHEFMARVGGEYVRPH